MDNQVLLFKALADETRLQLLQLLLGHDLCVGALAQWLGISPGAVSQHLRLLRRAGLVKGEKRGYWTHYSVERQALAALSSYLEQMAGTQLPAISGPACLRSLAPGPADHQGEVLEMCKSRCQYPEKLKGKPEECTPEQIKECHGDTAKHPCGSDDK